MRAGRPLFPRGRRPLAAALLAASLAAPAGAAGPTQAASAAGSRPMNPAKKPLRAWTPQQLVPLLPERLGAWQRESLEAPKPGPRRGPVLRAEYEQGRLSATLSLFDERRVMAPSLHEAVDAAPAQTGITRTLGNGLTIVALSRSADAAALKALIESLDLAAADALPRP